MSLVYVIDAGAGATACCSVAAMIRAEGNEAFTLAEHADTGDAAAARLALSASEDAMARATLATVVGDGPAPLLALVAEAHGLTVARIVSARVA